MSFFGKSDIRGVLYLAGALLLSIGLMSYNPLDPSLNSLGQEPIQNYGGYIGSFLSDLLYQGFGLGSYLFVLFCLKNSFLSFSGKYKFSIQSNMIWGIFILTSCSLLTLAGPEFRFFNNHILIGGAFGQMIVSSLVPLAHKSGAIIILTASLLCCLISQSHRPVRFYLHSLSKTWFSFFTLLKKALPSLLKINSLFKKKSSSVELPPIVFNQTTPAMEIEEPSPTPESSPLEPSTTAFIQEGHWDKPSSSLLPQPPKNTNQITSQEIHQQTQRLIDKLAQFSITGEMVGVKTGPAVTLFEFRPADSVKVGKITQLADDLSMALSAESLRIIAPIPGRDVVGIEASNSTREGVYFTDIVKDPIFQNQHWDLPLILGRSVEGAILIQELCQMPHLMVAGSTGSGKSVFITNILSGLIMQNSPETLRLVLIDPKQVDLTSFEGIPHLLFPPIVEISKALETLNWAISEMNKRYRSLNQFHARGIKSFNQIVSQLSEEEKLYHESQNFNKGVDDYYYQPLPYICITIEEFGDLMASPKKIQVEQSIVRLAQMARACGIHLILAMQSPRKDVVTGLIKTNIPGRISFKVSSKIDSRVILDESGAERLLAKGDMLFLAPGTAKVKRCHGPFISEDSIRLLVDHWKNQGQPQYITSDKTSEEGESSHFYSTDDNDMEKYMEIRSYVSSLKTVSTSSLQRKFRLGYPRAARMMEKFEEEGLVSPAQGSKPREVLHTK